MVKNILLYLVILLSAFIFNVFYYAWFSWYLLVLTLCVPVISFVCSLPFMIYTAVKGVYIFADDELTVGDELSFGITSYNGKEMFCPLMKIKFKLSNSFTGQKKRIKFVYGGFLKNPAFIKSSKFTRNCGNIKIKAKYIKIYDLLGIFFIPIRLNYSAETLVMPKEEKPKTLPDNEYIKIIGYKPKTTGFAEEYELRNYQRGDSIRNIHWKISAQHNELIVKEPSTPIYRPLVIKPVISTSVKQNNATLGKFLYVASFLIENKKEFFCTYPNNQMCKISSKDDIKEFLIQLFNNQSLTKEGIGVENSIIYTITHNAEVVSV